MGEIYQVFDGGDEVERFEVRDLRVKTRFAIDNRFYDEYTQIFGPTLSMVYIALVRHANKEQKTWPSQTRIAAQLGIGRLWVGLQLQILEYFNLIRKVRVGKMCTNRYYLIDEKHWRSDFDEMTKELSEAIKEYDKFTAKNKGKKVMHTEYTSLMRTGINIRAVRSTHQMLLEYASNSKDKQERINKKGKKKITVKKTEKKQKKEVDHINIGSGSKSRTYFDTDNNQLVTEHYD